MMMMMMILLGKRAQGTNMGSTIHPKKGETNKVCWFYCTYIGTTLPHWLWVWVTEEEGDDGRF